jgi:hypothetical protein
MKPQILNDFFGDFFVGFPTLIACLRSTGEEAALGTRLDGFMRSCYTEKPPSCLHPGKQFLN